MFAKVMHLVNDALYGLTNLAGDHNNLVLVLVLAGILGVMCLRYNAR